VTSPGNQATTAGTAVSLQIHATDSGSGQTLTYSATGLPAGLAINSSTGLITGTPGPHSAGNWSTRIRVSDGRAATLVVFTWTVVAGSAAMAVFVCAAAGVLGRLGVRVRL